MRKLETHQKDVQHSLECFYLLSETPMLKTMEFYEFPYRMDTKIFFDSQHHVEICKTVRDLT